LLSLSVPQSIGVAGATVVVALMAGAAQPLVTDRQPSVRDAVIFVGVTAGVLGSVFATLDSGAPAKLPTVSLGSVVLLHAERAVALFIGYIVALTVVLRAASGELPTELRGLKWDLRTRDDQTADALEALVDEAEIHRERLARVERYLDFDDS
jgi:hypothetical protein